MAEQFKVEYKAADGTSFSTKEEVIAYAKQLRIPLIKAELAKLTDSSELVDWVMENREDIDSCFETASIKRVTKKDRQSLQEALEAVASIPEAAFLALHKEAIVESFRYPTTKRLNDEEKKNFIKTNLMSITENNAEVADWIVANKEAIDNALETGIEKKPMNESALSGLAAYRAKMKAQKDAEAASKAE